jgi:hypothetical protein
MNRKPLEVTPKIAHKISTELAYIVGVLHGDGYVHKNWFSLETVDKDFIEYFSSQVKEETGRTFRIVKGKPVHIMKIDGKEYVCRKTYRIFCNSVRFVEFLKKNFIFKTNKWCVPKQIFNGSNKIKVAYLRGIFDSEGHVGIYKNKYGRTNCRISISSKNSNALEEIKKLFCLLGFTSVIYPLKKREVFSLEIKKICLIVHFSREIGTSIRRKEIIFRKIEKYYKDHRKYSIKDYHKVLELKKNGFGSRKINKITKIPRSTIIHWIHRDRLPLVMRYDSGSKNRW